MAEALQEVLSDICVLLREPARRDSGEMLQMGSVSWSRTFRT